VSLPELLTRPRQTAFWSSWVINLTEEPADALAVGPCCRGKL